MNLSEGLIQSTCYSNLALNLSSVPGIMKYHDEVMKAIYDGKVIDTINAQAFIVSGAIREISRARGNFPDKFESCLKEADGCISTLMTNLTDVRKEKGWENEELFFAQAFDDYLSKAFYDYCAYVSKGDIASYKKYVDIICNLPTVFKGNDPKWWENNIKFYSLFMDSENFFYFTKESVEVVIQRIEYLFNHSQMTIGCNSLVYDQVLTIWNEQFFSKITSTTTSNSFSELYNKAIAAIEALLK